MKPRRDYNYDSNTSVVAKAINVAGKQLIWIGKILGIERTSSDRVESLVVDRRRPYNDGVHL